MKILVTGANGLLGKKLVSLLSKNDNIVLIATGKGANRNPTSGYSYFTCDLTDQESVSNLFIRTQPDAVIHAAAMTQVDDCEKDRTACWRNNVHATEHVIKGCQSHQSFLLYISTDFVFDGEGGPYSEEDVPNPISYYGESKLAAEKLVQQSGLKWATARTVLVYGVTPDMSRSNIVLWVKQSLEDKKPIRVVNDQWRTPTLVEDLAIGCQSIIEKRAEGVYHISGAETYTPYKLALVVAEYFNLDSNLITPVDHTTFSQLGKRPPRTGFSIDKTVRDFNYAPRTLVEGLNIVEKQLFEVKNTK